MFLFLFAPSPVAVAVLLRRDQIASGNARIAMRNKSKISFSLNFIFPCSIVLIGFVYLDLQINKRATIEYFSIGNRAVSLSVRYRADLFFRSLPITLGIVQDVRMVEDRSFEGVQPRPRRRCSAHPPRYIRQGQRQGDLHFHGTRTSGRNYARSTTLSKTLRVSSPSRAIKHSSAAQLLLPRTWSERGTANLLESEISEVLLVAGSRAFSSRFQCRSWCTISIRAARFIFFAKICKAGLTLGFYTQQKELSLDISRVIYLFI